MSKYRDTLEVGFNYLQKARWETFTAMPTVAGITYGLSEREILRRDAWIFMVRTQEDGLQPFYFDAIAREILPFSNNIIGSPNCKSSYSQTIGDGINSEFVVTHNLNSMELSAVVWTEFGQRLQQVDCDIFLLKNNLNQIGFQFAIAPEVDEFIVVITSSRASGGGNSPSPQITVNPQITTLPVGEPPSVANTGLGGNAHLTFSIPGSPQITVNPQITTLPVGEPPLVANTGLGGNAHLTFSIPGSPQITVNPQITTLPVGEPPLVANTGLGGNAHLTFSIPGSPQITVNPQITTLPVGEPPSVANTGLGGNAHLTFSIPGSPQITVNPQITTLPVGEPPLVANTGLGGNAHLTFSIPGSPQITVNPQITTLPVGEPPSVANTGTGGNTELTFSIPVVSAPETPVNYAGHTVIVLLDGYYLGARRTLISYRRLN